MNNDLISVIIPVYNAGLLIRRCLESVVTQQLPEGVAIEIILVDDCSTDNSLEVIAAMNLPMAKIFRQSENRGPAAARNRGLAEARGEYCAFLDADDYWLPGFLNETFLFLKENSKLIAVFTGQCHKSLNKPESIRPRCARFDADPQQRIVTNDLYQFWHREKYAVCTGSVLMRMNIVRHTNGQREDFRVGEDLEFWLFLATYGLWGFIPKVLFVSDGMRITVQQGWQEKNQNRWRSAPSMEDWESRILPALSGEQRESYCFMRGEIAMMLQYCMIVSGRDRLALQTQHKYHKYYAKGKITNLYRFCASHYLFWKILCIYMRRRELYRKLS